VFAGAHTSQESSVAVPHHDPEGCDREDTILQRRTLVKHLQVPVSSMQPNSVQIVMETLT